MIKKINIGLNKIFLLPSKTLIFTGSYELQTKPMNKAETPLLNTKQDIVYERALVEAGVKECTHSYMVEDYCMVCKKVIQ